VGPGEVTCPRRSIPLEGNLLTGPTRVPGSNRSLRSVGERGTGARGADLHGRPRTHHSYELDGAPRVAPLGGRRTWCRPGGSSRMIAAREHVRAERAREPALHRGAAGRSRAVSLGPYVAGVGSERCWRGLVLSALRPESRPRNKCVWRHLLSASSRQYLVPCTVAWSARPDWVN